MAVSGVDLRKRRRTAAEDEVPFRDREDREKEEKLGEGVEVKSKGVGWGGAFCFLMIARYYSAVYNNIHDCDEVFNYWEPLHYLLYKSGFQTWEYRYGWTLLSVGLVCVRGQTGRWLFCGFELGHCGKSTIIVSSLGHQGGVLANRVFLCIGCGF